MMKMNKAYMKTVKLDFIKL